MSQSFLIYHCSAQCLSSHITGQSSRGIADGCCMNNHVQSPWVCLAHHCTELLYLAELLSFSFLGGTHAVLLSVTVMMIQPFPWFAAELLEKEVTEVLFSVFFWGGNNWKETFSWYVFIHFRLWKRMNKDRWYKKSLCQCGGESIYQQWVCQTWRMTPARGMKAAAGSLGQENWSQHLFSEWTLAAQSAELSAPLLIM